MNRLTYGGLVVGILAVAIYALVGLHQRKVKSLDLADAGLILLSTVGATGAIRLAGFVLLGDFAVAIKNVPEDMWSLTADDGVFVVIGGMCLLWVSLQGIGQGFKTLWDTPTPGATSTTTTTQQQPPASVQDH